MSVPKPSPRTPRDLVALVRRFSEAQAALQAKVAGAVDAIVDEKGQPLLLQPAQAELLSREAARRREAETLNAILDALPAPIVLVAADGAILSVNAPWRRLLAERDAITAQQAAGRNFFELEGALPGDTPAIAAEISGGLRRVLARETPEFSGQYRVPAPDGGDRWFRVLIAPVNSPQVKGAVVMYLDVSQSERAEEALRVSEREQRQLAAQLALERARLIEAQAVANIGSWETDLITYEVTWTEQTHRIFETSPQQFRPTHAAFLELVHPDDRAVVDRAFRESTGEIGVRFIDHRIVLPGGRIRIVQERWQTFSDELGRPVRAVGTCQDITDRRCAEEALRASEERFQLAVAGSAAGIWDWLELGDDIYYSPRYAEMVGRRPEEFPPHIDTFWNIVHPEDKPRLEAALAAHFSPQRVPYKIEFRMQHASGEYRWFHATGQATYDSTGKALRMVGFTEDITERHLAQQRSQQQAALIDAAHDAIIVQDLDHRITFWSMGAERTYGWKSSEAVGRKLGELLKIVAGAYTEPDRAVRSTGSWNGELQKTTRDGRVLTVDARWTLLRDPDGQPRSILTLDTNITERKKLEQQFLRAQRIESIGTLAGGIAHDLNNLLAPIVMGVDLLKLSKTDEESLQVIRTIERSARRGAELVKHVLSFARGVEGSRIALHVTHLIREIEAITRNTFPKNIEFDSDLAADLWLVTGDPTQLNQVLLNLCVNARDAMPDGGRISIAARNTGVDEQYAALNRGAAAGRYVCIEVADTGCGMSREVLDRIFEPFFTTKEVGKGTGLGLSTVLGIVRSHGGFVNVYSEVGKGSVFKVYLPAELETTTGAGSDSTSPLPLPRGRGELVLVVDDEVSVREVTKQTLEAFGYRTLMADDGAQAIGVYALNRDEIALVLTDMMMPVMDGPALIAALRRIDPKLRVIAASGLNATGSLSKVAGCGVKHFLPKPYTAKELLTLVRTALDEPIVVGPE